MQFWVCDKSGFALVKSSLVFVLVEGWRLPALKFLMFPLAEGAGDCQPSNYNAYRTSKRN